MSAKYKIITLSDHPLAPSGVGLQTKYIIDHLVKIGQFKIISVAGAIKHKDYRPQKYQEWGDDVVIIPTDGYGSKDLIRQLLDIERPDAIWFITDPRFYGWLWEMEDEIHQQCPLLYWHVWDNTPYPKYNETSYKATDFIGCINRLTYNFLKENGFTNIEYLPHGVPEDDFIINTPDEIREIKKNHLNENSEEAFVVFYNSRNALRKRTGNVLVAWKEFLDQLSQEERDKCLLCMHSPPHDPEGQNLFAVADMLKIRNNVGFHDKKVENNILCEFYNMADITISLSSEEGFGLGNLESLMCGTPVICPETGGLQDTAIDWETGEVFGFCIKPDARSLIGSQSTPYIYSLHVDPATAAAKIKHLYDKKKELGDSYKEVVAGHRARKSVLRRFSLPTIQKRWEEIIVREIENFREKSKQNRNIKLIEI